MEELLNGTLEDAVRYLAKVAADRRTRPATVREKMASPMDFLSSLGDTVKSNPTLSHALVGGGIGAGLGGLSRAYGNSDKPEGERKSLLGGLVQGGLAGAGVGAGIGATRSYLNRPEGGTGTPSADFTDPATGDKYKTKPNVPADIVAKAKQLSSSSGQKRIAQGVGGVLGQIHDEIPITSTAAAVAAPIDLALHGPGGLSNITRDLGKATGGWGRDLFHAGVQKLKDSDPLKSPHLAPQLEKTVSQGPLGAGDGNSMPKAPGFRNWLSRQRGSGRGFGSLYDALGSRGGSGPGDRTIAQIAGTPMHEIETGATASPAGSPAHTRPAISGVPGNVSPGVKMKVPAAGPEVHDITAGRVGGIMNSEAGKKLLGDRNLYKTFGKTYAGAKSLRGAAGLRGAAYGIPMGVEYLARGLHDDAKDKSQLRDLLAQYAEKQPGN